VSRRVVAVVADSHFDEGSRFEECQRLHAWIADDMAARGVDLVLHGGDLYERRSTPTERRAAADWLRRVADRCPVVIVRGNHDAVGDLSLLARLRTRHPIVVEEAAAMHEVAGVAVAAVAWPRRAELLASLGRAVGHEGAGAVAAEALRGVLTGLGAQLAQHAGPRVLLMHAMVGGSITSTGQPLVGCDMELGLEDLALACASLVAIGHIHKGQDWTWDGVPIVYPGSPRRTAFGELEEKGYLLATFDGARLVSWERVAVPATPMVLIEGQYCDEHVTLPGDCVVPAAICTHPIADVRGAEVRVRYLVDADKREAARRAAAELRADLLARGAVSVRVEEQVEATTRARAPEVAEARTLPEQLRAFWESRDIAVAPARQRRVFDLLTTLETETR
jgi:exonuclease SbcD